MKYLATIVLVVIGTFSAFSQTYEVGAMLGGSNFIGDVGRTNYIAPNDLAFGGIFKWNRSARHSFRGSVLIANISGDDSESNDERRQQRGYTFENTVTEISLGLEYTFWEFNMYNGKPASTPYLYTGLTYSWFDALYYPGEGTEIQSYDGDSAVAIPMVVGYKATLGRRFVVGFEIGARYTFSDALDGSYPSKGQPSTEAFRFGNTNSDDWYVFTGITFTVTFGRKPCYCNF
ncbi:type IX secretion system protein PorG [Luteirhabdus pelagi]|uniref:type IX secretion system protein PorG n=1 Tax=Luteirhabdus pelagi TaxID=2792783 RepID=UPI00193A48A7|nr:DUF6089 family protein [Luteirhabdus pelagi]